MKKKPKKEKIKKLSAKIIKKSAKHTANEEDEE